MTCPAHFPGVDEVIKSQDDKLQEIKRTVFSGMGGPIKLCAEQAILMSAITDMPAPALMISTHYNDHEQPLIDGDIQKDLSDADVDFSKAEDFLQLETPIDARKDHNMLKLACTIPSRTFMSRILHRYPIHKKRLAYIQRKPTSSKTIEVVSNMLASMKGGESKEITISCQVCGQKFSRQHQFQRHILTHPDPENKKFLCQICGKRFNRADHLNRHAILHGDIKVHKCLLCGEEFDRASHLDRHRRKLHPPAGQAPSQTPPLTPQAKTGFPFPSTPDNSQGSGNNLHLLAAVATPDGSGSSDQLETLTENELPIEEGQVIAVETEEVSDSSKEPERPFPCEVCGRKFIRATHLRRHMRIHTGEKPFACHICGRRYARGDYLRAHIHAHRRDKIHKCKHCGEVFHDLTRFADHCRIKHKDDDDEFGNPRPPPDMSPPPPIFKTMLESTLTVESAEEITVVQTASAPLMMPHANNAMADSVQITLVNVPEPSEDNDVIITSCHLPTPPLSSPELQLAHLQTLASQTNSNTHIHNGQLPIPDTSNEVTILSQPKAYIDPIAQYMMTNGNHSNNNGPPFPTPSASPIATKRS